MAHFNFVISQNAKWGYASFYIDRHRMTSLLTCAWLISILWLVLGLQSKIKICVPENILLKKSTGHSYEFAKYFITCHCLSVLWSLCCGTRSSLVLIACNRLVSSGAGISSMTRPTEGFPWLTGTWWLLINDIIQSTVRITKKQMGKNSRKVLPQYFAYGRVSWQDN